jgi:two-component system alkaline phosphatase synthesis response regulator PhoP
MTKDKILVIDDEEDILELLRFNLTKEGYQVCSASTGEEALSLARTEHPDLVLLDLMLPGIDGLEVARRLKADPLTRSVPIVMLTAKGEESDIVTGLELGAEDYITKPFSRKVLVARLRAVLRRKEEKAVDETTFLILSFLARRPGWVFTRSQIVDAVKGDDYFVTDRAVDVQVVGLRKKLGSASRLIETVRGVGYRFKE